MLTPEQAAFVRRHLPGFDPRTWQTSLAGAAGSQRRFVRLQHHDERWILMIWDRQDPDWPRCLGIHDAVRSLGLIPRIAAVDEQLGLILEEDLGSITLKDLADRQDPLPVYREAVLALNRWQSIEPTSHPALGARVMGWDDLRWESAYFAEHCVAGHCHLPDLVTPTFETTCDKLAEEANEIPKVWMHRDFQSENLMVTAAGIRFVDYQGARLGPWPYDLASLLYDPYVTSLSASMRAELICLYAQGLAHPFADRAFHVSACQRLMQALGAYGKLARQDGKLAYLRYIPVALQRLDQVVTRLPAYTELAAVITACRASLSSQDVS